MDIGDEDNEIVDIELDLAHIASSLHSSLNRCQPFSQAITEMLCNPSHHGLLIYKIYIIN